VDATLVRLGARRWVWALAQHQLVSDAWSFRLVYERVSERYRHLRGDAVGASRTVPQFQDYREMLVKLGDNRHVEQVQVKNVLLAVRLARHTARGWDNPALPDDIAEIGALLLLGPVPTLALLRDIDSD